MIKKLLAQVLPALALMFTFSVAPALAAPAPTPAPAATPSDSQKSVCEGISLAGVTCDKNTGVTDPGSGPTADNLVKTIINTLSIIVGAVCVIMIIIGGFRYVVSGGDSSSTKGAKDTILYAVIGLVIVLFAQVIVRFVFDNVSK